MGIDAHSFHVVVVEATPAGIAMAVRAAREGLRVLLATRGRHWGGMLASGLGVWDTLIPGRRAPIYDEVRAAIFSFYRETYGADSSQYRASLPEPTGHANGRFEPSVAAKIFERLVAGEPLLTLWRGVDAVAVEKDGPRIIAVDFRDGATGAVRRAGAEVFADCTYEGDLAALAGVSFRVGREAREEFGEPHAGRIFIRLADPERTPPPVAALAERRQHWKLRRFTEFQEIVPTEGTGGGDQAVQAFNYRTILSRDPKNQVKLTTPADCAPEQYRNLEYDSLVQPLPNEKVSWNRPQLPGCGAAYVLGDASTRQRIRDEHWATTLSLLHFLQSDASISPAVRDHWRQFGLAQDEFPDHANRPYELYVREGRRIVGRTILTEHDTRPAERYERAPIHADSIGVTEWYVDIHACGEDRVADSFRDGKMMLYVETVPGQVPYGALLPRQVDNLLVPVGMSATHVAFSAVRLEPTWMALGEAAGFAAAQAVQSSTSPTGLDTERLQRTLAQAGVMLAFFNDVDPGGSGTPAENAAVQYFGTKGFFPGYEAKLDQTVDAEEAAWWATADVQGRAGTSEARDFAARLATMASVPERCTGTAPQGAFTRRDALLRRWNKLKDPGSASVRNAGIALASSAP